MSPKSRLPFFLGRVAPRKKESRLTVTCSTEAGLDALLAGNQIPIETHTGEPSTLLNIQNFKDELSEILASVAEAENNDLEKINAALNSAAAQAIIHNHLQLVNDTDNADADFRHIAGDIAWGDVAWMSGSEIMTNFFNLSMTAAIISSVVWPFAIGALVLSKYFYDQVQQIYTEKGRPPTKAEYAEVKRNTIVLGTKVFAAVAGWEMGALLANHVTTHLVKAAMTAWTGANPLVGLVTILTAAAIIGLCAGLGVMAVNLFNEWQRGELNKKTLKDNFKLFAATAAAGSAWFLIKTIPIPPVTKKAAKAVVKSVTVLAKSLLTYLAVKFCCFDLYKKMGGEGAKKPYAKEGDPHNSNYYCGALFQRAKSIVHIQNNYSAPRAPATKSL